MKELRHPPAQAGGPGTCRRGSDPERIDSRKGVNRRMHRATTLVLFLSLCGTFGFGLSTDTAQFPPFGTVSLYYESPHPAQVVIFISGDGGWNRGVVDMARSLASLDALVIGVDIVHYLRQLEAGNGNCLYPASDFEALSQFIQKRMNFPDYVTPILIGYSSGATLVYAVIVQAPSTTFAGAVSLGFCPDLAVTKPFCRGSGLEFTPGPKGTGVNFLPASKLEVPWIVLQGAVDQVCDPRATAAYVAQVPNGKLIALPKVGHGFAVQRNWLPQFKRAFAELAARKEAGAPPPPPPGELKDLPLSELPATGPAKGTLVVFITGDGGYGVTDKGVCTGLAAQGYPVVVLNSLKYFWTRRTPDGFSADLARILHHYRASWRKDRVALIGYSLGADVLPFGVNRLPQPLLDPVRLLVLLGPSRTVEFEFHLADWFRSTGRPTDLPVLPEVQKLRGKRILAFYGDEEQESLCRDLDPALVKIVRLKGGHRIGSNYSPVLGDILAALRE